MRIAFSWLLRLWRWVSVLLHFQATIFCSFGFWKSNRMSVAKKHVALIGFALGSNGFALDWGLFVRVVDIPFILMYSALLLLQSPRRRQKLGVSFSISLRSCAIFCRMFWGFAHWLVGRFCSYLLPEWTHARLANPKHSAKKYLCAIRWKMVYVSCFLGLWKGRRLTPAKNTRLAIDALLNLI